MRRILISSLGIGTYVPCDYHWPAKRDGSERVAQKTRFVQRAIVELLGEPAFDEVIVLVTHESREKYGDAVAEELGEVIDPAKVKLRHISSAVDDLTQQWRWFEALAREVSHGDRLVIDMTHGFRAVPIVLSAALGYLQRTRGVVLDHVLYGAHDCDGAIVDMRDFYVIQEWADAVGRLVDGADASKLADLASTAPAGSSFARLTDPALAEAFRKLTSVLKNVDVQSFASATQEALDVVERQSHAAGVTDAERQLLDMVRDKYVALVTEPPAGNRHGTSYLELQLAAARQLSGHGLHMQAFTVLSELIGSIGMLGLQGTKYDRDVTKSRGRDSRHHADVFKAMVANEENDWKFDEGLLKSVARLVPWFRALAPLVARLRKVQEDISGIRNGFNHGWTAKSFASKVGAGDADDLLRTKSDAIIAELTEVVSALPAVPPRPAPNTP